MTIKHKNAPKKSLCSSKIGFSATYHFLFLSFDFGMKYDPVLDKFCEIHSNIHKISFLPCRLIVS